MVAYNRSNVGEFSHIIRAFTGMVREAKTCRAWLILSPEHRTQCLPKFKKYEKDHYASYKKVLAGCITLLGLLIPIFFICVAKYFFSCQSENS